MAPVLNQISCDGSFFTRLDGVPCAQVFNARRAGAFLVGQLMAQATQQHAVNKVFKGRS
jgi:hypothetical protein